MPKKINIIEINGRKYDASTGVALSGHGGPHQTKSHAKPAIKPIRQTKAGVHRQPAKPAAARQPAASHTLMRHAVKKPAAHPKPRLKAQGHTDALAKPMANVVVKPSVSRLDSARLRHAKKIHQSRLISRFPSSLSAGSVPPAPEPKVQPPAHHSKPAGHHQRPAAMAAPRRGVRRPKTTSELLDHALRQANSHTQPERRRPGHSRAKRNTGIAGIVTLAVLVMGIIITQNVSDVRLQMASAKAGFNASLPGYQPSGFSLGNLDYGDGLVAARFDSNSDQRYYTVTQKRSNWDNTTLLDTTVRPADAGYQAVETGGRTVYLYGDRNAAWLDKGVWYQVKTNAALSDRQLLDIAKSI